MLVQFTIKNVLSFKEETTLDMTAINAYKEHEYNLIDIGTKEKFLRVGAIYGANASGKSNLFLAMYYFREIIVQSFNNIDNDSTSAINKYYKPFFFEQEKTNSEFQIIEILNHYEYKYGFEYNPERIVSEWMYRKNLKTNRTSIIFERISDTLKLGASVREECNIYKEQIPPESLVLSFFNKLKLGITIFKELYSGIMNMLVIPTNWFEETGMLKRLLPDYIDCEKEKLIAFLKSIDTGIEDIRYDKNEKDITFYTVHSGEDGKKYQLSLFNESEGTVRCIIIYMNARYAISYNSLMFVDELNVKLHPLLLKFIIDLFNSNRSTAQLIYTTHDTTLLDKKFFRRDQIWFVQKDELGRSELIALSDFKIRSDASFEKDYLAGVYGGIPVIKDFTMEEGE